MTYFLLVPILLYDSFLSKNRLPIQIGTTQYEWPGIITEYSYRTTMTSDSWTHTSTIYIDENSPPMIFPYGAFMVRIETGYRTADTYGSGNEITLILNCDPSKPIPNDPYQPNNQ